MPFVARAVVHIAPSPSPGSTTVSRSGRRAVIVGRMPRRSNALRPDQAVRQCGATVVRVRDLESAGLRRSTIAKRCRPGGPWRSLIPGVVLLHNAPPTRPDRRSAALLHCGSGAVLTGLDALELHGIRRVPSPSGPVHVLIPADRRRTGHGVALVERTERLPAPEPGRWPLAPLPRAVLDFARRCRDRDQVRSGLAEVVQRRRCSPAELVEELRAGSMRGSALPRDVLREVGDGVRSVAEAKARVLLLRSGLPRPLWNPTLVDAVTGDFIAVPDAWFDDVGMAWEIDSHEWHLDPEDHARTLARRVAMTARGIALVAHTPGRITREWAAVHDEIGRNHAQAARRPRPAVVAIPAVATNGTSVRF